ncbi:hypothetical protein [Paenibacillus sp. JJ-223]|uniref:hypothetical protein n=1 Tax=Paenibacillus sp. JJ-223 TaxID=2905647 RepID=UPI001F45BD5F|nr:hypothetical protein [Paenibacillus sp. JJ-223]CAH1215918.1 hypothetical protein PAECIP111890_04315 [Paenibacillus sp. JJ-223]
MKVDQLEEEVQFIAANARHNLDLIHKNPEMVQERQRERAIEAFKFMEGLHDSFEAQKKNARQARRTLTLRTRLKSLVLLILSSPEQKRKGETV